MHNKILVVGPSWVGDMVMAQVLFKLLKQQDPHCQIDVLAPNWSLPVLSRMPEISQSIPLPIAHGKFALATRIKIARQIKQHGYNQAIVLPNSWKSALIPWLAKIPLRTGMLGEMRFGLLNDVRFLNKKALPKMVQRYAQLALSKEMMLPADLPAPKLSAPPDLVAQTFKKFDLNKTKPILALCPGAAFGPAKRWPPDYFAQIAKQRIEAGWQVWLFGSTQDNEVIETIRQKIDTPTTSFGGKIDLMETIDLLSLVDAVVTNDSGLLHIAASLDKPLVAIYGSTSATFTPPLGKKSRVVEEDLACRPCFKRQCPLKHFDCMLKITPDRVQAAIHDLEEA